MKTVLRATWLAVFATLTTLGAHADAIDLEGYRLVWSDEFNGTNLNTKVWNIEVNGNGGGNQELQYYAAENVSVDDGCLIITSRRENSHGKAFTSGRINSLGKAAFRHGRIDASIRLPHIANGMWPAFWLMGNDMATGTGWPYCGEIDVMEAGNSAGIRAGTQDRYFGGALHWGPYTGGNHPMYAQGYTAPYTLEDDFHLFSLVWDKNNIKMYLDLDRYPDAKPYFSMAVNDESAENSPGRYFHKQFFILFNVAVGGNYTGIWNTEGITALANGEQQMLVDYVRVYQQLGKENYVVPEGSEGTDDPDVDPDNDTPLGQFGSLAIDDEGQSTFDFDGGDNYVLVDVSNGFKQQVQGKVVADYSQPGFLNIWSNSYTALPVTNRGNNSIGQAEDWRYFAVNNLGWSGLGFTSSAGVDLSMLDDDYILHFAMRGVDPNRHTSHGVRVGNARFTIGNHPFVDEDVESLVVGDFPRDGRWTAFDIPVKVLRTLAPTLFDAPSNYTGNVFALVSGGTQGAHLEFDQVFFYKNPNASTDLPTDDSDMGQYASPSLTADGAATFDFNDGYDYVLLDVSATDKQRMSDRIRADYNVDGSTHLLTTANLTPQSATGNNSMGASEPWRSFITTGEGTASMHYEGDKDLSMLDDSYYLHFAMRGEDLLRHTSHTITVGQARFVIGNATTEHVILGDFHRDGQWYSFDIPVSLLHSLGGENWLADEPAMTMSSGYNPNGEVQLDAVFFYRRYSDTPAPPQPYNPLGKYCTRALTDDGQPTFNLTDHTDYVLIVLGEQEADAIADCTVADYRVNDVHMMQTWDKSYRALGNNKINSFGLAEGYTSLKVVAPNGWSGLGFISSGDGKNLSMLDEDYMLHLALRGTHTAHPSIAVGVGAAHFALGTTPFVDGEKHYSLVGDYPRDGQWYNFDIPMSEVFSRATPVFDHPSTYTDAAISFLTGGVAGVDFHFDAIFFYHRGEESAVTTVTREATVGDDIARDLLGRPVTSSYRGIVIKGGRKYLVY